MTTILWWGGAGSRSTSLDCEIGSSGSSTVSISSTKCAFATTGACHDRARERENRKTGRREGLSKDSWARAEQRLGIAVSASYGGAAARTPKIFPPSRLPVDSPAKSAGGIAAFLLGFSPT